MSVLFERMVIVGVGLIGGSLAKAVKEKNLAGEILGIGRSEERLARAKDQGIIDGYSVQVDDALSKADLIVVATPVGIIIDWIKKMIPFLYKSKMIL